MIETGTIGGLRIAMREGTMNEHYCLDCLQECDCEAEHEDDCRSCSMCLDLYEGEDENDE